MEATLMKRLKELEDESRGSKKCMLKSASRQKSARKPLRESCKAISAQSDDSSGY